MASAGDDPVQGWDIDDRNRGHATTRLTEDQLWELLDNAHAVVPNPPRADGGVRTATHVLIGRLDDGSPWAVPMVSTSARFAWRPLTAYPINRNQLRRFLP